MPIALTATGQSRRSQAMKQTLLVAVASSLGMLSLLLAFATARSVERPALASLDVHCDGWTPSKKTRCAYRNNDCQRQGALQCRWNDQEEEC